MMQIPLNSTGLSDGWWLRWPELEAWLRTEGYDEVADRLAGTIADDDATLSERKFRVRT
jgi:hypothetical protein